MKRTICLLLLLCFAFLLCGCGGASGKYNQAQNALAKGDYGKAAELFESISTYEDSSKLAMYSKALLYGEQNNYSKAIETLDFLGEFKDSAQLKEYYGICMLAESEKIEDVLSAVTKFDAISAYRDSASKAENCRQVVYDHAVSLLSEGYYKTAKNEFVALGSYRDSEDQVHVCEVKQLEKKNVNAYAKAEQLFKEGDYDKAIDAFEALGDYNDSATRVVEVKEAKNADVYANAEKLLSAGNYDKAIKAFRGLGDYRDSATRVVEVVEAQKADSYSKATDMLNKQEYEKAKDAFENLGDYKDSVEQVKVCNYNLAIQAAEKGSYAEAIAMFEQLGDFLDSEDKILQTREEEANFFADLLAQAYQAARVNLMDAKDYLKRIPESYTAADELRNMCEKYGPFSGDYILYENNSYSHTYDIISKFRLKSSNVLVWSAKRSDGKLTEALLIELGIENEGVVDDLSVSINWTNSYGESLTTEVNFIYADTNSIYDNRCMIEVTALDYLKVYEDYRTVYAYKSPFAHE